MAAHLLDGRALAGQLRARIAQAAARLPLAPSLVTVVVGDDPASAVYVRTKLAAAADLGFTARAERLPTATPAADVLALIHHLNADSSVHGILLQLPVPAPLHAATLLGMLDPRKDVDGLTPHNAGLLAQGRRDGFIPCTPLGCLQLLRATGTALAGKRALVIGRSLLVGRPMASLLLGENCTVTQAHSGTADLPAHLQQAEIVIAAIGRAHFIQPQWVRPGAIVIDVGITRTPHGLAGDVDPRLAEVASFLTPVPGGVGPMTVACLMANTLRAACQQQNLPEPPELRELL